MVTPEDIRYRATRLELIKRIRIHIMKHGEITPELRNEFYRLGSCYGINCEVVKSTEEHVKCPLGSYLCGVHIWQR